MLQDQDQKPSQAAQKKDSDRESVNTNNKASGVSVTEQEERQEPSSGKFLDWCIRFLLTTQLNNIRAYLGLLLSAHTIAEDIDEPFHVNFLVITLYT